MIKKDWLAMLKKGKLAIVSRNGRSLVVTDKAGVAWKVQPSNHCTWSATAESSPSLLGFGDTIWEAIKDAKGGAKK